MSNTNVNNKDGRLNEPPLPILVLGVGNILLSDEGIGVRVVEELSKMDLPDNVELLDGGTASDVYISFLAGRKKVIIVDSVKGGGEPLSIYRFNYKDVAYEPTFPTSLHQVGVIDTLQMADFMNAMPKEAIIIGIEPLSLKASIDLSPEMAERMPKIIEIVLKELENTEV